jgi:hypothetical protein
MFVFESGHPVYAWIMDNKNQTNNDINEIKEFWSNEVQFNNQAEWISHLENEIPDSNNPHHIQISLEILIRNTLTGTKNDSL